MTGDSKRIAVYGTYIARVPVKQRYWKRRTDGIMQRYWKKTTRTREADMKGRFEFIGKGKELYQAVVKAHHIMPKDYITVSAKEFVRYPERYGYVGEWIDREVSSK